MAAIRQVCNDRNGCFMENNHPKLEDFDGPYGTVPPRDIQSSDIDGVVEVDGYFLFKEFKGHGDISRAQEKLYERLSRLEGGTKCVVMHIVGQAAYRRAEQYRQCINGKWTEWTPCDWQGAIDKAQMFMIEAKERYRLSLERSRERRKLQQK